MAMERGKSVLVEDFDALVKDLKKLDPQLRKDFDKALKIAAKPLVDKARSFVPSEIRSKSGRVIIRTIAPTYTSPSWVNDEIHRDKRKRWVWSEGEVRRGIKVTKITKNKVPVGYNKVATAALAVVNRSAIGSIFELAGKGKSASQARTIRKSRNPKAREDFVSALASNYPVAGESAAGRLVYRAEAIAGLSVREAVAKVIDERLKKFVRGQS